MHVIATSLNTATGGRENTLRFIGLQQFAGMDDVLPFIVRQNAPDAEVRQLVNQYLRLGLARYLARTEGAKRPAAVEATGAQGQACRQAGGGERSLEPLGAAGRLLRQRRGRGVELGDPV